MTLWALLSALHVLPATTVNVAFTTNPAGGAIFIDGRRACDETPCEVAVRPGPHIVQVRFGECTVVHEQRTIDADSSIGFDITALTGAPVVLRVRSIGRDKTPVTATVSAFGQVLGSTPGQFIVPMHGGPAGELTVQAPGFSNEIVGFCWDERPIDLTVEMHRVNTEAGPADDDVDEACVIDGFCFDAPDRVDPALARQWGWLGLVSMLPLGPAIVHMFVKPQPRFEGSYRTDIIVWSCTSLIPLIGVVATVLGGYMVPFLGWFILPGGIPCMVCCGLVINGYFTRINALHTLNRAFLARKRRGNAPTGRVPESRTSSPPFTSCAPPGDVTDAATKPR